MLAIYSMGVVIAGTIALGVLGMPKYGGRLAHRFPGFRATWSRVIPGFDLGRCCIKKPRFTGCGTPAYTKADWGYYGADKDPGCCSPA